MVREEDLPIDIYYNKLLDWLIDRRHCQLKWQESASQIREKINVAIQDMPPNEEITKLLSGTYINFFHCKRIIELLKVCGEGTTNIFGQYSSKRMKDWQSIINDYSQESVFLAEAAQMIMRNVNYEVPALKRQIAKCQQTQRECLRKQNDCNTNSALFKEKYLKICKQMGISGDNVRKELVKLVDELPSLFDQISENTKALEGATKYYSEFIKFVVQKNTISSEDITPLIKFIIQNGNATVYQWKTGEVPSKVEEDVQKVNMEDMAKMTDADGNTEEEEIDWGIEDDGGIDYGDDAGIDFGDDANIDWGDGAEEVVITVEEDGQENPDGGVATGQEALSVMENTATRNTFIDELMELEAFLEQRIAEMSLEADMITVHEFQTAPEILQQQTKETLLDMLNAVSSILKDLTSMKMQNLYLIKSSSRYVDRIADSLQQKLKISQNLLNQMSTLQERHDEALKLQTETEPKLALIVKKTKELQAQVEEEISCRYKNRKVNIMGEINTI